MLLVFDQKSRKLRRDDNVVWRILFLGIYHPVFLAGMDVQTFERKPALLLGAKRRYEQNFLVLSL
jgi:hypothetical protein